MISSKLRRPERRVLHLVGAQVLINGIGIRDDLRDQPLRFASSRPAGRTKAGADHQEVIAGLGVTSAIQSLDGMLELANATEADHAGRLSVAVINTESS